MKEFIHKYEDRIHGVLSCFDRMLFRGYLPIMSGWSMAQFLKAHEIGSGDLLLELHNLFAAEVHVGGNVSHFALQSRQIGAFATHPVHFRFQFGVTRGKCAARLNQLFQRLFGFFGACQQIQFAADPT